MGDLNRDCLCSSCKIISPLFKRIKKTIEDKDWKRLDTFRLKSVEDSEQRILEKSSRLYLCQVLMKISRGVQDPKRVSLLALQEFQDKKWGLNTIKVQKEVSDYLKSK